jgi:eukaryotic translation initiation factor 2C
VEDSTRPVRPDQGKSGRAIKLISNHFRIQLPKGKAHHYDLMLKMINNRKPAVKTVKAARSSKDKKAPKAVTRTAVQYWLKRIGQDPYKFAFDGRCNLYSRERISVVHDGELNTFQFEVPAALMPETEARADGSGCQFELQVSYAAEIDFDQLNSVLDGRSPGTHIDLQQVLNVSNILLKQQCLDYAYPDVRNTVFPPSVQPERPIMLGGALELWNGFYQSVRPSAWKTLNVDVSYSAFLPACDLLDILMETVSFMRNQLQNFATRPATDDQVRYMNEMLRKRLRQTRVEVTLGGITRKYTFDRLSRDGARIQRFEVETNGVSKVTTVEEYFRTQKNYTIKYPFLPLVKALGRNTYLPLELCRVMANQHYSGKLEPEEQAVMVRNSR